MASSKSIGVKFGVSSASLVRRKYGQARYQEHRNAFHRNGRELFLIELETHGMDKRDLVSNINFFSRVDTDEAGNMRFHPGNSPAGSYVDLRAEMDAGVAGKRIGVVTEFAGEGYEPAVTGALSRTLDQLSDAGADVIEVSLPTVELALSAYYLIAPAECSANLARFDGMRYGLRIPGETTEEMMARTRAEGFGPEVIRRILLGTYALSAGYYDAFYGQAHKARTVLRNEFAAAYEQVDVLMSPTSPTVAFPFDAKSDPLAMYLEDIYTLAVNLAGLPGMSVPAGLVAGKPVGLQLIGRHFGEARLLNVAHRFQQATDWHRRSPGGAGS